ncbi:MAG: hypothetical protein GXO83_04830 [Chlorobi bacterium]|nr:hypothetical protein [Chlorobiota bacterium]
MKNKTFCTAVNCMDGRVQEPAIRYLKEHCAADYVDMITLPGPEKVLAGEDEESEKKRIRECIAISVEKHGSAMIGVFAHHDCAGNPASRDTKEFQVKKSAALIKSWFPETEITGFYINENREVEKI